ncbi:hypothetical protein P872_15575 [Rhodonellum psychrophilum GCM71 = DSM 17998]|uniref:Uncharacterized protein n=1 Tax=Rhodonellum psychrophilum GCM71 = DSM 17998 TaxID=1123057 RepID=U5C5J3_9BACT|nr:hypothetical protein P872_15575 [Rhodonellum psychrophilum GCM71 = DSM 17998]
MKPITPVISKRKGSRLLFLFLRDKIELPKILSCQSFFCIPKKESFF